MATYGSTGGQYICMLDCPYLLISFLNEGLVSRENAVVGEEGRDHVHGVGPGRTRVH